MLLAHLFKTSNTLNPFLESESHLDANQVAQPLMASEVTLQWDDLSMLAVQEDSETNRGAPLRPWNANTAVPAPPMPPPMIAVFGFGGGRRPRRGIQPTSSTSTASTAPQAAVVSSSASSAAPGTPPITVAQVPNPKPPEGTELTEA